jgi:hypothetical protein
MFRKTSLRKFRPGATLRANPCLSISEILLTPTLGRRGNWRYDWFSFRRRAHRWGRPYFVTAGTSRAIPLRSTANLKNSSRL